MFDPAKTLTALQTKQTGFTEAKATAIADLTALDWAMTQISGLTAAHLTTLSISSWRSCSSQASVRFCS